eukprot:TRINITY_DN11650_c0_g1_i2.p1 TRINITY_DN11650_c0_g1~~TRINITY_DN11650_c0_g1_i2.p1  ORF type:complete len:248 (-),score=37.14 TRINITY_DN11650_c0_g1_i2:35-778(-)
MEEEDDRFVEKPDYVGKNDISIHTAIKNKNFWNLSGVAPKESPFRKYGGGRQAPTASNFISVHSAAVNVQEEIKNEVFRDASLYREPTIHKENASSSKLDVGRSAIRSLDRVVVEGKITAKAQANDAFTLASFSGGMFKRNPKLESAICSYKWLMATKPSEDPPNLIRVRNNELFQNTSLAFSLTHFYLLRDGKALEESKQVIQKEVVRGRSKGESGGGKDKRGLNRSKTPSAVSYTHLTLPTIYSV